MSTLAAALREQTANAVRGMSAEARIALALRLGDDDLALFCAATGRTPEDARRILSRTRDTRRRPSAAAQR